MKTRQPLLLSLPLFLSLLLLAGCARTRPADGPAEDRAARVAEGERVEVGYGSMKKADVTGAVSSVDVEQHGRAVTRVEELLQGRVAGVYVMQTPTGFVVRIRGANALRGNAEPLYVVDGIPVQGGPGGGLSGINPNDIASIEVLKDAGSTSIYGSRGANGVVIITTKRGR